MSEYAFKNLSDVETVAEPADGTTVMGFQNGTPIQMPMSAIKTEIPENVFLINPDDSEYSTTDTAYGDKVKEALLAGKQVWVYDSLPTRSGEPINYGYYSLNWFSLEYKTTSGGVATLMINYASNSYMEFVITTE